jgi:hypothetical protein
MTDNARLGLPTDGESWRGKETNLRFDNCNVRETRGGTVCNGPSRQAESTAGPWPGWATVYRATPCRAAEATGAECRWMDVLRHGRRRGARVEGPNCAEEETTNARWRWLAMPNPARQGRR